MNTLRFDVKTKYLSTISSVAALREILASKIVSNHDLLILGGGSNILFTKDYPGVVIKNNIKGINVSCENDQYVHLEIMAGEEWPSVVEFAVSKGWGGIENLAMVPGTAGAAPVQNIASYGHNLHESLVSITAIKISDCSVQKFRPDECDFGYRTSIFKKELKGKYVITSIELKLSKNPILNTSYKSRYESVEEELEKIAKKPYQVKDVYKAIKNIRNRKMPNISEVGTVGSVFKNPLVTKKQFEEVSKLCPHIHFYPETHLTYDYVGRQYDFSFESVKIPAAWLIEDMGWAGKRIGNCGTWKKQPINLVNYGDASPEEYLSFMNSVKKAVFDKYSIKLETEVIFI